MTHNVITAARTIDPIAKLIKRPSKNGLHIDLLDWFCISDIFLFSSSHTDFPGATDMICS